MSTVAVNSESLQESGAGLVTAREDFADSEYVKQLKGVEDHTKLSPGQFPAGAAAERRLTAHYRRMMEVFGTTQINLMALSSALYILADVYEDADHSDALRFAFAQAGVEPPNGLPAWFDKETTFQDAMAENAGDGEEGEEGVEVVDPDAYAPLPEGHTRSAYSTPSIYGSPYQEVTVVRDADDNVISRDYKVVHNDGSTDYYTETYDEDGTPVRSDQMSFGPQGQAVEYGDAMQWAKDEGDALQEEPERMPDPEGS